MTITAQVIEHSIDKDGRQIASLLLRYPRFIHAELMTHRMFSRNASSSRAIPFKTQLKTILKDPATFVHWGANQKGMSADEELEGWRMWLAQLSWSLGLWVLQPVVWLMNLSGVHKQVINRMLEPWSHINVLVTATEWDNFFELRCNKATTQPEMWALAWAMHNALTSSKPVRRQIHLPFVTGAERQDLLLEDAMMISAARCARLSYMTHGDISKNVGKDLELARRLLSQGHMSPFEHQATAITSVTRAKDKPLGWRANFFGWESFRFRVERGLPII